MWFASHSGLKLLTGGHMDADSLTAQTLLRVIALVCAMACLSWGLLAGLGRVSRPAAVRFLGANVLLVASVYLTLARSQVHGLVDFWLAYWLADVLGLVAIALFLLGTERLLQRPASHRWVVPLVAGAALTMALLPYPDPLVRWRGMVFSGVGAVLAWSSFQCCVQGLRSQVGFVRAAASGAVFATLTVVMLVRALGLWWWPEQALALEATSVGASVAILWASLVEIVLVNLSLAALLLVQLLARIQHLAMHDELTACLNRRAIEHKIDDEVYRQKRAARATPPITLPPSAVVMLDLDHFKRINDEFGHLAGDAALRHVAGVVLAQLRQSDAFGRWGGEEFLLLLSATQVEQAREAAARIRQSLHQTPWMWHNRPVHLTASFAVAPLDERGLDFEALDQALYRAKQAGRDCIEMAQEASSTVP